MNRSSDLRWLRVVRAFDAPVLALLVVMAIAPAHAVGRGAIPAAPDQRRETLERMTPEQRQQWRNARMQEERQRSMQGFGQPPRDMRGAVPSPGSVDSIRPRGPEQRQDMRNQLTPDERQALRQRFFEQQRNNRLPNGMQRPDMQRPDMQSPPPRQLTPAERQQLREQIMQARERYRNGPKRGPGQ